MHKESKNYLSILTSILTLSQLIAAQTLSTDSQHGMVTCRTILVQQ